MEEPIANIKIKDHHRSFKMTFDPGIPVKTQSPGLFPDQMHADLNRLKTMIETDHVFNNTAQANDGIHKQVRLINNSFPIGGFVNGENGIHFAVANALGQSQEWYVNNSMYLPETSIKAIVNFDGSTGAPVMRAGSFNVTSVTRPPGAPVGTYRITFIVPFVSNANGTTYTTHITTMQGALVSVGNIRRNVLLSSSQNEQWVDIETFRVSDNHY